VKPSEAHFEAAKRLLARETATGVPAGAPAAAAGRVHRCLFESLAPIVGDAGVRALLARSARLNRATHPALADVLAVTEPPAPHDQVAQDLVASLSKLDPVAASAAGTALYATFLGLLASFIGDALVSRLVEGAFPATTPTDPRESE
jgi:hypothetical protein